jgi:hypothetical protein
VHLRYVGAEVAIGSLIVNYLQQSSVLGLDERSAGELIAFYWGGAMVGRFIGSAILRVINPGLVLACAAAGAIGLILLSTSTTGELSGYSLLAVGLVNSIMFPTIFSLACERLGSRAADGSGIINVAIFGGAVVPLATGALADLSGSLAAALLLPAFCYAVIAAFGLYCRRNIARDYETEAALEATETSFGNAFRGAAIMIALAFALASLLLAPARMHRIATRRRTCRASSIPNGAGTPSSIRSTPGSSRRGHLPRRAARAAAAEGARRRHPVADADPSDRREEPEGDARQPLFGARLLWREPGIRHQGGVQGLRRCRPPPRHARHPRLGGQP